MKKHPQVSFTAFLSILLNSLVDEGMFLYYIHVNYSKSKVHSKEMLFFFFFYFNNNPYINLLSHIPVSSSVQFIL